MVSEKLISDNAVKRMTALNERIYKKLDKVTYRKHTFYKLFNLNVFTKTEIYSEVSGQIKEQPIQFFIKSDYYNREFEIKDDKKE